MRDDKATLAVVPEQVVFDSSEELQLERYLQEVDRHSLQSEISDPADVRLDSYGKIQSSDYRFTASALAQLCQRACPGLTKVAFITSGLSKSVGESNELYSVQNAARIMNEVTSLRFEKLRGKQLLRDTRSRTIDGVIGSGYFFLSNSEFFDRVKAIIPNSSRTCIFHEGVYCGRRLAVVYRDIKPLTSVDGMAIYCGYSFSNAETGDCSVRSAPVVILATDCPSPTCIRADRRKRIIHAGAGFDKKMFRVLHNTVLDREAASDEDIKAWLLKLSNSTLGFGRLSEESHKKRLEAFEGVFTPFRISKNMADRIVRMALYGDGKAGVSRADYVLNQWSQRTAYHLLAAIMQQSRRVSYIKQELLERVAYYILSGKTQLPNQDKPNGKSTDTAS